MRRLQFCLCIGLLSLAVACDEDQTAKPAPDPPIVSTGLVLSIGRDQAIVSGEVDPHGVDTVYWFDYGSDSGYGARTPDENISSTASGVLNVSALLTGLAASTDYHYRLSARNSGGTVRGSDATFRTLDLNVAPDTRITAVGTDTLNTIVRWALAWSGMDSDGEVVGFELRIANHGSDGILDPADSLGVPWTSTVVTDTMFTWQDGLGSRTAWIRALDDEGARDPTPASRTITAIK